MAAARSGLTAIRSSALMAVNSSMSGCRPGTALRGGLAGCNPGAYLAAPEDDALAHPETLRAVALVVHVAEGVERHAGHIRHLGHDEQVFVIRLRRHSRRCRSLLLVHQQASSHQSGVLDAHQDGVE